MAALAVLTLAACSGIADDAPTDADAGEFCEAYLDFSSSASDVAQRLADVGTPATISGDERTGFEAFVEGLDEEGDTPRAEVETVDVPQDDQEAGEAFIIFADETCAEFSPDEEPTGPTEPTDPAS